MTKAVRKLVKCAKCGNESEQLFVYSVNFMLGTKEGNESLMKHQQICPKCNYTNFDISILIENDQEDTDDTNC